MDVLLALAASFLFALGTVLQQRVAARESDEDAVKAGFLLRLVRRPLWLAGVVVDGLGTAAQAVALGIGRLVIVQPVLAMTVVFALPLGARLTGQRVGRREVAGALAVSAGLGVFLVVSDPAGGVGDAPLHQWLVAGGACAALSAALVAAGLRARPARRAFLLGAASGVLFGLTAALIKAVVDRVDDGPVAVLTHWHVWALIVVGLAGMSLSQAALQTGVLAPAIAAMTALDPLTSVALGIGLLDERPHASVAGYAGCALALAVLVGGLALLAGSRPAAEAAEAAQADARGAPGSAASRVAITSHTRRRA